jgi:hypothetical protein
LLLLTWWLAREALGKEGSLDKFGKKWLPIFFGFYEREKTSRITNDDGPSIIVFESREGNFIIRLLQRLGDRKSGLVKKNYLNFARKQRNNLLFYW